MTHLEFLKIFLMNDLGIDMLKWDVESDEKDESYACEDECRGVLLRSRMNGEYTMYVVMQHFKGTEWVIIDFSLSPD